MRIAVCLSGQPRTWRHAHASLFRYFAGHDVDVFVHSWNEVNGEELKAIVETYSPRDMVIEARPLFLSEKEALARRFPVSPPFFVFDMFHSVAASLRLGIACGGYDLICRARFDMIFDGAWDGATPPPNALFAPSIDLENGLNDQFALGDPEAMAVYAGMTDWLPGGLAELPGPIFRPELALHHYIAQVKGMIAVPQDYPLKLLRPEQVEWDFTDVRDDPLFHALKREEWEAFANQHLGRDVAGTLNFEHYGKTALALDRWVQALPADIRQAVLAGAWPRRIQGIDRLIAHEIQSESVGPESYTTVRLLCAALIHRMERDEPITAEGFVVHALSANYLDMRRAQAWLQAQGGRSQGVAAALSHLPVLQSAIRFAPPLDQKPLGAWRNA